MTSRSTASISENASIVHRLAGIAVSPTASEAQNDPSRICTLACKRLRAGESRCRGLLRRSVRLNGEGIGQRSFRLRCGNFAERPGGLDFRTVGSGV